MPAEVKSEVESKVADVRSALETEDADRIKSSTEALSTSMQQIGQAMYAQQQANAGTRGPGGPERLRAAHPTPATEPPTPAKRLTKAPSKASSARCKAEGPITPGKTGWLERKATMHRAPATLVSGSSVN